MKMSQKLIVLFSLLAILMTVANSIYFYQTRIEELNERTYENLNALGNKMVDELEEYVKLMDYALEELTSNVDFMKSMYIASQHDDNDGIGELVAVQTLMSRTLYQSPLVRDFHRVSVYSRNGFYLSSRFENTDTVINQSDEARETIASLPYLAHVDETPFQLHLIGPPHQDPWTNGREVIVFTAVRAAIMHGQFIGYMEVSANVSELYDIFYVPEVDGLLAQAILDEGTQLFHFPGDDVIYCNIDPATMTRVPFDDGSERLVVSIRSKALGLTIYVSQDMSVYSKRAQEMLIRYVSVACGILFIALFFIAISSLGLTRSIRRLIRKMKHLPVDNLMAHPTENVNTMVTKYQDLDIYQLEQVFNDLINRLQISHHTELSMREGTLQAQLNSLQMQINPHFVYNTLNIISSKSMESGNEEVIEICNQFAQMLRYSTDLRSITATLGEEIENARRYLLLSKARYEDQLNFVIDIPAQFESLLLPKLTIQPIIENALTHGYAGRSDQRMITISGTVANGMLYLTIRDNGNGFDKEVLKQLRASFKQIENSQKTQSISNGGHIGLINTYLRLYYYSKGTIRMWLYNNCGAVVELKLPCVKEDHDV